MIEYHDLPGPKDGSRKDCWISIHEPYWNTVLGFPIWVPELHKYHYTTPGGSYITEYINIRTFRPNKGKNMNENFEVNPELVPVIDGTDVTLAPAATREGEAASEETTVFIAEDAETV